MGMEPICGQAFGAKRYKILGFTMQKMILLLLLTSIVIASLWFNMKNVLLFCGQDENIANEAQAYILYSLPDLVAQSILHPLRTYLRTQSITLPLTYCSTLAILLHIPINYLLVSVLDLGIKGVALGSVLTNINLVGSLIVYMKISGVYKKTWGGISSECLKGWKYLLNLSIPSCISVCLEWWWYEIMILLCGLLLNPQATVASMGILIQTTALIYIFPSSLSFGVSTRVGNELGANNPNKAKLAAIVGLSSSSVLGLSALVFAISVRKQWATMFTQDPEIIALTSMILPILGLCELGNCPQTAGCGVLRGTARPKLGANINLGCFYLVGMPVAVWLSFFAGFDFKGLWVGLLAAQASCVVAMFFTVTLTDWDYEAWRAQQLTTAVPFDTNQDGTLKVDSSPSKESLGLLHDVNKNDLPV
ncbi:LOB domain-containing protein 24 [Hibiscus syriacus]|uniref:LOB domain-containing protein 24 n=2 Tax=Hibiscus syriacus TaxID=106335 RepID=A0A6A3B4S9_HIBSY|nr:LOB domain-containing protein 24 [Hibiscus syriacus]